MKTQAVPSPVSFRLLLHHIADSSARERTRDIGGQITCYVYRKNKDRIRLCLDVYFAMINSLVLNATSNW